MVDVGIGLDRAKDGAHPHRNKNVGLVLAARGIEC